jgi:hypothetical protein
MAELRMVRLVTVTDPFEAKLLAARLGSEGVVWQLRGAVDGPYPMGPVDVLVEADRLEEARELTAPIDPGPVDSAGVEAERRPSPRAWIVAAGLVVLVLWSLARFLNAL